MNKHGETPDNNDNESRDTVSTCWAVFYVLIIALIIGIPAVVILWILLRN